MELLYFQHFVNELLFIKSLISLNLLLVKINLFISLFFLLRDFQLNFKNYSLQSFIQPHF